MTRDQFTHGLLAGWNWPVWLGLEVEIVAWEVLCQSICYTLSELFRNLFSISQHLFLNSTLIKIGGGGNSYGNSGYGNSGYGNSGGGGGGKTVLSRLLFVELGWLDTWSWMGSLLLINFICEAPVFTRPHCVWAILFRLQRSHPFIISRLLIIIFRRIWW